LYTSLWQSLHFSSLTKRSRDAEREGNRRAGMKERDEDGGINITCSFTTMNMSAGV